MAIDSALIHRARLSGFQRSSTRDAQGQYGMVALLGPWVPARLMERGGPSPEAAGTAETEGRVVQGYELLLSAEDESGATVAPPTASAMFETDCPVLGDPTIKLSADPEVLNDGEDVIGFLCFGTVPAERS